MDNLFKDFKDAICLSDSYKGNKWPTTRALVRRNVFIGKEMNPLLVVKKKQQLGHYGNKEDSLEILQMHFVDNIINDSHMHKRRVKN